MDFLAEFVLALAMVDYLEIGIIFNSRSGVKELANLAINTNYYLGHLKA